MDYKVITAVASPVIALDVLRSHLLLDMFGGSTHPADNDILAYLADARENAQHYTQRSIGQQTLELAFDTFPSGSIELVLGAASIVSIKYIDMELVERELPSSQYTLDDYKSDHWAIPVNTWPASAAVANAVKVRYTTPATIPAAGIQAMKLMVTDSYKNREGIVLERGVTPVEMPLGIRTKLDTFRKWGL